MSADIKYGTSRIDWDNDIVPRIATFGASLPDMTSSNVRNVSWESNNVFGSGKPNSDYVLKSHLNQTYNEGGYSYTAKENGLNSIVHAFTFYMGKSLKEEDGTTAIYNPFTGEELVDTSAKTKIMNAISTKLNGMCKCANADNYLQPESGIIQVSLNWSNPDLAMSLSSEIGTKDISASGCTAFEHYYVKGEEDVSPGVYAVSVTNSGASDEISFPQSMSLNISTPGDGAVFNFEFTSADMLNLGHVADIIISEQGEPPVITPYDGISFESIALIKCYGECKKLEGSAGSYAEYIYEVQSKLKQALLGPLSDANITLTQANNFFDNSPFYESSTTGGNSLTTSGVFYFTSSVLNTLEADTYYVTTVIGGDDIDANDDGELDAIPTHNGGSLHAIVNTDILAQENFKVNILTEIAFQLTKEMLSEDLNSTALQKKLDEIAIKLLKEDVDGNEEINYKDILAWVPIGDKDKLIRAYESYYVPIVQKIYNNETIDNNTLYSLAYPPTLEPLTLHITENSEANTIVGQLTYISEYSSIESMSFQTESQEFSIDKLGVIRVKSGAILDHETMSTYILQAYATNSFGKSDLVYITIYVDNELDAPELQDFSYSIEENSKNISFPIELIVNQGLSPITSIDIFDYKGTLSTTLKADVNGTIFITDTANLDYETTNFIYFVKAYNDEGVSKTATLNLNLINVLDAPELSPFTGNVNEDATIGTVVGKLTLNPGLSAISSIVLDSYSESPIPFSIDKEGIIRVVATLDYETIIGYSFFAYAINEQGRSKSVVINIGVNDVIDSPILYPLYTDINESIHAGDLVGTVSYKDGLDKITEMSLFGEDSAKFTINSDGKIYLKNNEKLDFEKKNSYDFSTQAFSLGYSSNIVDIHVVVNDIDEYGIAGIGRWANAQVNIYRIEVNGTKSLVFNDTTSVANELNSIGLFDSHKLDLNESDFYIYEINGGEENDIDNDGVIDPTPTTNQGTIHAIIKGSWVRDSDWRPRINLLTEVYYQWAIEYINDSEEFYNRLINPNQYSLYLNKDLNGDSFSYNYYGNAIDAIIYDPNNDLTTWNLSKFPQRSLRDIQNRIYSNDPKSAWYISNSFLQPSYIDTVESIVFNEKNKVYMSDRSLKMIDLSDFSVTTIMQASMDRMTISEDRKYLFFTAFEGEGDIVLKIFDISNKLNPIEVSTLPNMVYSNKMKLSYDTTKLYTTFQAYNTSGFKVIDITDKSNPILGVEVTTSGQALDFVLSQDEQTVYLTDDRGGLKVINISSPNSMRIVGEYIANGLVKGVQLSEDETKAFISVSAPTLNINTKKEYIQVVDITDKSNPILVSNLDLNCSNLTAFTFSQDFSKLLVSDGSEDKLFEIKENFQSLELLGKFSDNYQTHQLIFLENNTIMLSISRYYIFVVDISDTNNPFVINQIALSSLPN